MKKIKVLHLVEGLEIGGRENVIASIARGINREEYDLEVWAVAYGGKVADDLVRDGIKVRVLNIATYHNPFNIFKLASLMKKSGADIVHTHGYYASTVGRIAAKVSRTKVIINHADVDFYDPNRENLVEQVSTKEPTKYGKGSKRVLLIDCGVKTNIIKELLSRETEVLRVPWNYPLADEKCNGILISNGPGDPKLCAITAENTAKARSRPSGSSPDHLAYWPIWWFRIA